MNDSNTAAELRNDLGQIKRDKQAETMRPLIYDRTIEILTQRLAAGDTRASESITADDYDKQDYLDLASLIVVIHKENKPGLAVSKIEELNGLQLYAYARAGMMFIDKIVDSMIESAVKQAEEELL